MSVRFPTRTPEPRHPRPGDAVKTAIDIAAEHINDAVRIHCHGLTATECAEVARRVADALRPLGHQTR